jgi:predicted metalloendopeptidase
MSPESKRKALAKLAAFEFGLAYPDHWLDDGPLAIERGDAFGNLRRGEAFTRAHNLARLNEPVDPIDWPVNPQVSGAVIMFSPNAEFFTAGLLQPPYFDPQGDLAANYGSAGAAMAHEVSHSFDELGHLYDDRGRLRDWWTAEDQARYRTAGVRLKARLDADCPLTGLCLKGEQVLGESLSDLAGLAVAYDAYHLALKGRPDRTIGGLSGDQRFFIAFAQRWRRLQTETSLRHQVATDTHPPAEIRSDAVRNLDAWYRAFDVRPGDKLYLKPEDRAGVW